MHFDLSILRYVSIAVVFLVAFGSRLTTGSSRQTADGLVFGIKPVIVPSSVFLALGFSVAIGLFFGSYPASRAAGLRPIEALRYE